MLAEDEVRGMSRQSLQFAVLELRAGKRLVCHGVSQPVDEYRQGIHSQVFWKSVSCGVRTTCADSALASTISGTSSSTVRAPSRRMFIANSSYGAVSPRDTRWEDSNAPGRSE